MSTTDDQAANIRTLLTRGIRKALGLHEQFAAEAAGQAYEEMRQHYAGDKVYMPGLDPFRREKVLEEYDGSNASEICRKHRISQRTLDRYVSSQAGGS